MGAPQKIMKKKLIELTQRILTIFVLSLAVGFSVAGAQTVELGNLSGKVLRGSPTTYLDLFGKMFPGAKATEYDGLTAERTIALRRLFPESGKAASEKTVYAGSVEATFRENLIVRTAKEKYLIVFLELSAENQTATTADEKSIEGEKPMPYPITALALFRLAPQPEFLDAVEAPGSILNSLEATAVPKYFWLVGAHQNCLTEYDDYTLLKIDGDRFQLIYGELPMLVVSTDCGTKLTQRPVISLGDAAARPAVNLTIVSAVKQFDDKCTGRLVRKYTKYFRYRLAWEDSEQKYTARQKADKALHDELVKFGFAFDEESN
jgi:hypothetical protein